MATIIELNAGFEFKNNKANKTYTIEKLIGSGGFADVFLVHENETKKKYRY
jgi:serine/threonine protein kinase